MKHLKESHIYIQEVVSVSPPTRISYAVVLYCAWSQKGLICLQYSIFTFTVKPHSQKQSPSSVFKLCPRSHKNILQIHTLLHSFPKMGWRNRSSLLFVLVLFFVHVIDAMNFWNNTHQAEYNQFLLANGVARTPPMG